MTFQNNIASFMNALGLDSDDPRLQEAATELHRSAVNEEVDPYEAIAAINTEHIESDRLMRFGKRAVAFREYMQAKNATDATEQYLRALDGSEGTTFRSQWLDQIKSQISQAQAQAWSNGIGGEE